MFKTVNKDPYLCPGKADISCKGTPTDYLLAKLTKKGQLNDLQAT